MDREYLIAGAVTLFIAFGCILLPPQALSLMDEQKLNQVRTEQTQEVTLSSAEVLGLAEKITLFTGKNTNTILLDNGRNYTREEMEVHVWEEMRKLQELGVLSKELPGEAEWYFGELSAVFYLNVENGNESMIQWKVNLNSDDGSSGSMSINLFLDDETGKIIALHAFGVGASFAEFGEDFRVYPKDEEWEDIAEKWGGYLGIAMEEVTQEYGNYYRNEFYDVMQSTDSDELVEEMKKAGLSAEEIAKNLESLGMEPFRTYTRTVYRENEENVVYYLGRENNGIYLTFF